MSFEDTPDYSQFIDTQTLYRAQCQRVSDQQTRMGDALRWEYSIHDRVTGAPVLDDNDRVIIVSRLTSPRLGPRSRGRSFVNALFGRELAKDELTTLIRSGQLANQLKGKSALAYVTFTDADGNETEFPRIDTLYPLDTGKSGKKQPPPPRSYEAVCQRSVGPAQWRS